MKPKLIRLLAVLSLLSVLLFWVLFPHSSGALGGGVASLLLWAFGRSALYALALAAAAVLWHERALLRPAWAPAFNGPEEPEPVALTPPPPTSRADTAALVSRLEASAPEPAPEDGGLRDILESALKELELPASVVAVTEGPSITRFELAPSPGAARVTQLVASREEDLRLRLRCPVRVAAVEGKSVIGLEVPRKRRRTVALKEVASAEGFLAAKDPVTIALGIDLGGKPRTASLRAMPHLLVAGVTRSGKTTFLRTVAASLLLKSAPAQVGLVVIDCKRVDLSCLSGAPHLLGLDGPGRVIQDPEEGAKAVRRLNALMDARYRALERKEPLPGPESVVLIIDELADLLWQTADADAERGLERLAALGGAAGFHVIVGTQRPSHDLISTRLRASLDGRAAFRVSSRRESNLILDGDERDGVPGAERLVGAGDMLIRLPGRPIERLQAAYIGPDEVRRIVGGLRVLVEAR